MRTCVECYRPRPPKAKKYCDACRRKRQRAATAAWKAKNPDKAKAHQRKRVERRRNDPALRKRHNEIARQSRERIEQENPEAHERRKRYLRDYWHKHKDHYNDQRPIFLRCPDDGVFDHWIETVTANPPEKLAILHDPGIWQPFNVPDYLSNVPDHLRIE